MRDLQIPVDVIYRPLLGFLVKVGNRFGQGPPRIIDPSSTDPSVTHTSSTADVTQIDGYEPRLTPLPDVHVFILSSVFGAQLINYCSRE